MPSFKPFLSLLLPTAALALGQARYVETVARPGSFPIAQAKTCAAIYVDAGDYAGVIRAAGDLQADIAHVTGCTPVITHDTGGVGAHPIVIGSVERSPIVKLLTTIPAVSSIVRNWFAAIPPSFC